MWCQAVPTTEEALSARLIQSTTQALELYGIYLGKELGLYAVANVLVSEDHPAHLAPLAQMVAGIGGALDRMAQAYRTGGGVAYPHFGAAFRKGQAGINRPAFLHDLVTRWIPAAPDLYAALTSAPLRVADVGCGAGWSTQAMAGAFPLAQVVGFDADAASVGEHFHAPADDVERLMYGWSIVHCLPVSLAEQPSAAIGTVIRPDIVRTLATAAGLARVEVVPVDGGFFRLFRLRAK
jgi:hypothetical protein